MDFPTFVKEIYSNCKNLGIPPTIIPSWIKDMFDFYLSYSDGKTDSLSDINIPFISQISFHIEQKKKEYADLKLYKKRLKEDIQKLEAQKNNVKLQSEPNKTRRKGSAILSAIFP